MLHTLLIRVSKSHLGSKLSLCSVLNRQMSSSWSVRGTSAGVGAVNAIRQCEEAHFVDADLIAIVGPNPTPADNYMLPRTEPARQTSADSTLILLAK